MESRQERVRDGAADRGQRSMPPAPSGVTPMFVKPATRRRRPTRIGIHAVADDKRRIVAWAWIADPGDVPDVVSGPLAGTGILHGDDTMAAQVEAISDASNLIRICNGQVDLQIDDALVRERLADFALPNIKVVAGMSLSADARDTCLETLGISVIARAGDHDKATLPRLLVATDGSFGSGARTPVGGWSWVDGDGRFQTGSGRVKGGRLGATVAEVRAVIAALKGHHRSRGLLIRSDSVAAIELAQRLQCGRGVRSSVPRDEVWGLQRAIAGRDVAFEWVRGHTGDPMNECADRLAVAARRCRELVVASDTASALLKEIAAEYLAAMLAVQERAEGCQPRDRFVSGRCDRLTANPGFTCLPLAEPHSVLPGRSRQTCVLAGWPRLQADRCGLVTRGPRRDRGAPTD